MLNTVLWIAGIVCLIAGSFLCARTALYNREKRGDGKEKFHVPFYIPIIGLALIVFSSSFAIIPTGYTGIRVTFGQVDEETVQSGFTWKLPFIQSIVAMNNKQQDITFEGQVWSETSERTAMYYDGITVTYQIENDASAWIYSNVTNYQDNLVNRALVESAVKTVSKTLNATDATNRGIIEPLALQEIQKALDEKYGEGIIKVAKVTIANADFEDTYNQAIAEKQNAQLEYERQQIENQKAIEAAEAQAQVQLTQANAEAEATRIKAQAEAEANQILADSLSEEVMRNAMIEKWDGQLPKVTTETGMMFDTSTVLDE